MTVPSGIAVAALLRRVNDAGGLAVVRARGEAESGAILLIGSEGAEERVVERGRDLDGRYTLHPLSPSDSIEDYWRRRRARDPDLWVVALDIAGWERFAAETILGR